MKKLTLVAAMMALVAVVATSYAEVQQVRLSGELRLRGYWTDNLTNLNDKDPAGANDSDTYIAQRTRVTVEADLEDHVLMVVTLQAQDIWGGSDVGAGFVGGANSGAQKASDVHLVEGYVRFQELFWSPLSLQIGRQPLGYGRGLILSNAEKEYRFDAARFVWDVADRGITVDLVAAKLSENALGGVGADGINSISDNDLWFLNARWEPADESLKMLKDAELYIGRQTGPGAELMVIGLRGDATIRDNWNAWCEFAWETGNTGALTSDVDAWLFDLGTSFQFVDMQYKPTAWIGYTLATGSSGTPQNRTFQSWFEYNERGGSVLQPALDNIQILSFGVDTDPAERWTLGLHGYWYKQDQKQLAIVGHPNVDNGGVQALTNGTSDDLGWEFNAVAGYNYSKDVRANLIVGWFLPGDAYDGTGVIPAGQSADEAFELRGEILVNF